MTRSLRAPSLSTNGGVHQRDDAQQRRNCHAHQHDRRLKI